MNRTKYFLSLIGAMAFALGLAASSPAQEEKTPLIRANPNPVIVPAGQTSGTVTLTWNGGKDHPYAEVWVRVDQNDETFIVESGRGTRQATVELGKTYVFKLSDANVLLASVTVTAMQGAAPSDVNEPQTPVAVPPGSSAPNSPGNGGQEEGLITGHIRWKTELGVVPMGPGNSQAAVEPCSVFYVAALDAHTNTLVTYTDQVASPFQKSILKYEDGEFHVCKYTFKVPQNRSLYIVAGMGGVLLLPKEDRTPYLISDAWIGGSRSKPPAGWERSFNGFTYVTVIPKPRGLNRAIVNFDMVYVRKDLGVQ